MDLPILSIPHDWIKHKETSKSITFKCLVANHLRQTATEEVARLLGVQIHSPNKIVLRQDGLNVVLLVKPKNTVVYSADQYETALVAAINGAKTTVPPVIQDPCNRLAGDLKARYPSIQSAKRVGASKDFTVTPEWQSFAPTEKFDTTPKTDLILEHSDDKADWRVSLKKGSSTQLMSGGRIETLATIGSCVPVVKSSEFSSVLEKIASLSSGKIPVEISVLLRHVKQSA